MSYHFHAITFVSLPTPHNFRKSTSSSSSPPSPSLPFLGMKEVEIAIRSREAYLKITVSFPVSARSAILVILSMVILIIRPQTLLSGTRHALGIIKYDSAPRLPSGRVYSHLRGLYSLAFFWGGGGFLVDFGSVSSLFEVFQTCENLYYASWAHMTSLELL